MNSKVIVYYYGCLYFCLIWTLLFWRKTQLYTFSFNPPLKLWLHIFPLFCVLFLYTALLACDIYVLRTLQWLFCCDTCILFENITCEHCLLNTKYFSASRNTVYGTQYNWAIVSWSSMDKVMQLSVNLPWLRACVFLCAYGYTLVLRY